MFLERYEYKKSGTFGQFYFHSDGPKGRIRKVVMYKYRGREDDGFHYFNVGFGDFDPRSGKINDLTVTDNKDREKILATVAATAVDFTRSMRKCKLSITGSTIARTRLYQMKIAAYYDYISELFEIEGETEKGWEKFERGKNYLGFRFKRIKFGI
ncbi:MAG TPA: hypothetical protein VGS79_11350 [Puia sp.]|nr:hypothetical protein [Puia sp.]